MVGRDAMLAMKKKKARKKSNLVISTTTLKLDFLLVWGGGGVYLGFHKLSQRKAILTPPVVSLPRRKRGVVILKSQQSFISRTTACYQN